MATSFYSTTVVIRLSKYLPSYTVMTNSSPLQRVSETCSEENCSMSICSYNVPIKRFFLPVVGSMSLVVFPIFKTYMYLPFLVFISFLVIFWNFPYIITFMNCKPLYYEDLFIVGPDTQVKRIDPDMHRRFKCVFEFSLILTNALFTAALSEYWIYQVSSDHSYVEILGVTGGILKIFQSINHMNGCIILHVTRIFIDKELKESKESGVVVELRELSNERQPELDIEVPVTVHKSGSTHSVAGLVSRDALQSGQDSFSVLRH